MIDCAGWTAHRPRRLYGLQGLGNTLWPPARQQWLYGVVAPESRPAANAAGAAARAPMCKELTAGLRVLRDLPLARSVVWIGIAWGCIGGAYDILLAAYATGHLGGGAAG